MFIAAQFTIAKLWNQPRCPSIDEWVTKLCDIHTMDFYSATKKEQNYVICRKMGMDPPYDPSTPLLGIIPKELKSEYYSNIYISMFRAKFTIAKLWN